MNYELNGNTYEVIIIRKNNKNLYIRVKEDEKIYVTCNYITSNKSIKKVLDSNKDSLIKMLSNIKESIAKENSFYYLGRKYDIIIDEDSYDVKLDETHIIAPSLIKLEKWKDNETIRIFDERYVYVFNHFYENIKSPILKIRNMKTRWGVYNRRNHSITLNSKLIEYDISKIDYVIIHELSHIVYFNHSKAFWNLVNKYCPDYKKIRKEMK